MSHELHVFVWQEWKSYITTEALHQCITTNSWITIWSNCVQQLTVEGNSVFTLKGDIQLKFKYLLLDCK